MNIHQEVTIAASPAAVYALLMSSDDFGKMTGGRVASIAKEVGGAVSLFGGDIRGRNVELVPGKRVVQAWRSGAWPEGVYSIIRFELSPEGKGTKLVFDQAGHPEGSDEMLEGGWHQMYWQPMNAIFAGKPMPAQKM
jgi:activator of HSP90 ATPase